MSSLLQAMENNKKLKKTKSGLLTSQTRPLQEQAAATGLRSQPIDAQSAAALGATPKQQDMAASKQSIDSAQQQAFQPGRRQTLQAAQRTQQAQQIPESGDTVDAARNLINSAMTAFQDATTSKFGVEGLAGPGEDLIENEEDLAQRKYGKSYAELTNEEKAVVDNDIAATASTASIDLGEGTVTVEDVTMSEMMDVNSEDYKALQSDLSSVLGDRDLSSMTFNEVQQLVEEYSDSVTGQVDKARAILNDPNAPAAVREQNKQALRDMGASYLIATDAELDQLEADLQDTTVTEVKIGDETITGTFAEIVDDPRVQNELKTFISEMTQLEGVTNLAEAEGARADVMKKYTNHPLKDIFNKVAAKIGAWESVYAAEFAEEGIAGKKETIRKRKEVMNTLGDDWTSTLNIDQSTDPDKLTGITSILANGTTAAELNNALDGKAFTPDQYKALDGKYQKELDAANTVEEAATIIKKGQLNNELQKSVPKADTVSLLNSLGFNYSSRDLKKAIKDAKKNPDNYKSGPGKTLMDLIDANGDGFPDSRDQVRERIIDHKLNKLDATATMKLPATLDVTVTERRENNKKIQDVQKNIDNVLATASGPIKNMQSITTLINREDKVTGAYRQFAGKARDKIIELRNSVPKGSTEYKYLNDLAAKIWEKL